MFAGFAVVKAFVLLAGFFSAFSLGNIFAQGGGFVLDS